MKSKKATKVKKAKASRKGKREIKVPQRVATCREIRVITQIFSQLQFSLTEGYARGDIRDIARTCRIIADVLKTKAEVIAEHARWDASREWYD